MAEGRRKEEFSCVLVYAVDDGYFRNLCLSVFIVPPIPLFFLHPYTPQCGRDKGRRVWGDECGDKENSPSRPPHLPISPSPHLANSF
ncbi:MAG: hypothetical protein ACHBN1_07960 [Heteroscytonema crispum UTEX LB 1556]